VFVFGFGVLVFAQKPQTPNPQSPIPNPHFELIKNNKIIK